MQNKTQAVSLSIVIPVFNDEDHLKACLDSIAEQTVVPDEVIVVDNNCTDSSIEIARQYSFVKVVSEQEQGVLFARNTGFDEAESDVVGRIDADTQLPRDWTKRVLAIFSQTDIAAVSGPTGWHDAPVKKLGMFLDKNIRRVVWRLGSKDNAVFLFGGNMAILRTAWQDVRDQVCERKDVHEDIDLALHLFKIGLPVAFDDSLTVHTSSRRMNDSASQLKKYISVYKNTYAVHGIKSSGVTVAMAIVLSAHFGVKLINRGYDPKTRQFSLKKFIENESNSRVHPMG